MLKNIFVFCCFVVFTFDSVSSKSSQLSTLRKFIFEDYDKQVKPDDQVIVNFGFDILNLDICPDKQILTTNAWAKYFWKDSRLTWDPTEWNNTTLIHIDAEQLWLPDLSLYNGEEILPGHATWAKLPKAVLMSTGEVIFIPPVTYRTFCALDYSNWPWSPHNCSLIFGSWTYSMQHLNLETSTVEVSQNYFINPHFEISGVSYARNEIVYECCPDDIYPNLVFSVTVKRNSIFQGNQLLTSEKDEI